MDSKVAVSGALDTLTIDAIFTRHINLTMTKEKTADEGIELNAEPPPPVDIHQTVRNTVTGATERVKRPGAVDAFRWMSFQLEPSAEATDVIFQQVVDPQWLDRTASTPPCCANRVRR